MTSQSSTTFIRDLAREEGLPVATATAQDLTAALFGEASLAHALIAEVDAAPADFALYYPKYSTVTGRRGLHLEDVYVAPQYRNRHVGRALIEYLLELAGPAGMIEWWVMHSNDDAIGFYQRLGAKELDGIAVYRLDHPNTDQALRVTGLSSAENGGV